VEKAILKTSANRALLQEMKTHRDFGSFRSSGCTGRSTVDGFSFIGPCCLNNSDVAQITTCL
jgi:hypothetical protein